MKRFTNIALVALFACLLAGCGKSPDSVAVDFLKAVAKPDLKAASEMATPDTAALLNMAAAMGGVDEAHPNASFKVISSTVNGDTAKVKVRVTDGDKVEEEDVDLKKVDGKWKVSIPKDR